MSLAQHPIGPQFLGSVSSVPIYKPSHSVPQYGTGPYYIVGLGF